jgi:hypothetical protein
MAKLLAICGAFLPIAGRAQNQPKEPVLLIRRPTVIAFFPPFRESELERDPDRGEALADFQLYAQRVREPLRKLGVDFREVYARSFRVTPSAARHCSSTYALFPEHHRSSTCPAARLRNMLINHG